MALSLQEDLRMAILMGQAQKGEKRAYNELLLLMAGILKGFFQKRLGAGGEADDLVQEVLIAVHTSRHTFNAEKRFGPWMYAIARYKLADYWRKQLGRLQMEILIDRDYEDQPAAREGALAHLHEKVVLALNGLPEKQRRVIQLLKVDGYSLQETADQMKMTVAAIKVTAHRAYKGIRKQFQEEAHAND